ncbi:MAG: glutamate--tRNA ligase, partial [Eubacteriales bacterium]
AKHEGGDFLLRIEDTDQERLVEGAVDIIYRTLEKTGLIHDEGPDKDKGFGPYVQSERNAEGLYIKYAKELVDAGKAYYCFCDKERLESLKTSVSGVEIVSYDKHCASLSKEEVEEKLAAGLPYVIRINMPTEGETTFHDEIYGDITVPNAELDDLILIKSDGFPTYNFANVVDDHLQEITHVVRGNEYLSSAPKYNKIYEAFGWEVPVYVHCPLITNEEHQKLSKRSGHSSYEDLIEQGYITEAVINFVSLLGWSPSDNQEVFSLEELIAAFDYRNMSKSPAVFDTVKLKWMNSEYMKALPFEVFYKNAKPYIQEVITKDYDLEKIAALIKTRIEVYPDIKDQIDFFQEVPKYDTAMYCHKKMKTNQETSLEVLKELLPLFEAHEDYTNDALYAVLQGYVAEKGCKNGYAMWPIRTAVSGKQNTPGGATEIMEIIGKEESIKRINDAIALLSE